MKAPSRYGVAALALLSSTWSGCHHGAVVGTSHSRHAALPKMSPPPAVAPLCPPSGFCAKLGLPVDGEGAPLVQEEPQLIDLATAMRLTQAQNPWVLGARERIREALALQRRAESQWIPDLIFNPNWQRHDGQIQRFNGEVPTVSRSSLAVMGGPSLQLNTTEALYGPLVARQITAARTAGASAEANEQLLDVAVAYLDLLEAHSEIVIAEETQGHAQQMLELLLSFEKAGKAARADVARAQTESQQRQREVIVARARVKVVSARLAELLSLPSNLVFRPAEAAVVPLALVPDGMPLQNLIMESLQHRPELAENRAYVEAALQRWRAARAAPLIPQLNLEYNAGGFGGGPNGYFGNFDTRGDFTALAVWRLKNFGIGNLAEQEASGSFAAQANYRLARIENRITAQVASYFHVVDSRRKELRPAQQAVDYARESYRLNLDRIRRAPEESRPIELLQSIQALNRARLDYLRVVADFSRTQFRLYTAIGYSPVCTQETPPAAPPADVPAGPALPPQPAMPAPANAPPVQEIVVPQPALLPIGQPLPAGTRP